MFTSEFKGLFTWREGAPANQATRLEGLKHSPPLQTTHLSGTVSGLRELFFGAAAKHNKHNGRPRKLFFPSYFSLLHGHGPVLCLRLLYYSDLFRLTVILFFRYHWQMVTTKIFTSRWQMVTTKIFTSRRYVDSPARTVYMAKSYPA